MTDMAEVEPSTGNVRGHHQGNLILAKTLEDRCSPRLFQTSMDVGNRFKFSFQLLLQRLTVMP
jgi:hypothetical protein